MIGPAPAPEALRDELRALLGGNLVAVNATGDGFSVVVIRGAKRLASERLSAARLSERWSARFHVREAGPEVPDR